MNVEISSLRTITNCPRKFVLESKEKRKFYQENLTREIIKYGGKLKYAEISTEIFGINLWATGVEVSVNKDEVVVISKRMGKKLYKYHYYEAALYGYVFKKESLKNVRVIFKSDFYEQEMQWEDYVDTAIMLIKNIAENEMPEPKVNHECKFCPYSAECTRILVQKGNMEIIKGLGKVNIEKLESAGIKTIEDIAENKEKLEKLLGKHRGLKVWAHAKAFLEEKPVFFNELNKLNEGIFFDIESYINFHYLFGLLYEDKYVPFVARNPENEKEAFVRLLFFLAEDDKKDLPIYHYHNYEPNQFKKLLRKYSIESKIGERFLDIYTIFTNNVAVPVLSYSLKPLAKYFGFRWRTNLNGMKALQKFEDYLSTRDETILKEILLYNEDDVRATKLLWEILNVQPNTM
ncbi:MAG: TM0106 family RecB-like putative nuclease [Thermosipho sp. (in: Bacteria)]|nr:TM0106 family RecB-like putative nuclease [Thermosipho sp. (in: thermotogales)]